MSLAALSALRADLWAALDGPGDAADLLACAEAVAWLDAYRHDLTGLAPLLRCLEALSTGESDAVRARALATRARLESNHHHEAEADHVAAALACSPTDGEVLLVAATIAGRAGRHTEAIELAERAGQQLAASGDALGQALADCSRGTTLVRSGDDEGAIRVLEQAVSVLHAGGAAASATLFTLNLVVALGNAGRIDDRAAWLDRLDKQLDRDPEPYARAIVDFEWGRHLAGKGSLRRAVELLERAQRVLREGGLAQLVL